MHYVDFLILYNGYYIYTVCVLYIPNTLTGILCICMLAGGDWWNSVCGWLPVRCDYYGRFITRSCFVIHLHHRWIHCHL